MPLCGSVTYLLEHSVPVSCCDPLKRQLLGRLFDTSTVVATSLVLRGHDQEMVQQLYVWNCFRVCSQQLGIFFEQTELSIFLSSVICPKTKETVCLHPLLHKSRILVFSKPWCETNKPVSIWPKHQTLTAWLIFLVRLQWTLCLWNTLLILDGHLISLWEGLYIIVYLLCKRTYFLF